MQVRCGAASKTAIRLLDRTYRNHGEFAPSVVGHANRHPSITFVGSEFVGDLFGMVNGLLWRTFLLPGIPQAVPDQLEMMGHGDAPRLCKRIMARIHEGEVNKRNSEKSCEI